MRLAVAFLLGGVLVAATSAQVPNKLDRRYNSEVDQDNFPQKTPKQTLESLLQAIQRKKLNYAIAQLVEESEGAWRRVKVPGPVSQAEQLYGLKSQGAHYGR